MHIKLRFSTILLSALIYSACVDPFSIDDVEFQELLAVEGFFSNELMNHQVRVSRVTSIEQPRFNGETGADVRILDSQGNVIQLAPAADGIYETEVVAGKIGEAYSLHVTTEDGKEYVSKPVVLRDGPSIDTVYGRYEKGDPRRPDGIQVYARSAAQTDGKPVFRRWNYIETASVETPFPSNWVWLGGDRVEFRDPPIGQCWVSDTLRNVIIENSSPGQASNPADFPLRRIEEESHYMRIKYSIVVEQYILSQESYQYWETIRAINETQGSLSDIQPGRIVGNLSCVTVPEESVLGYFDAGRVSRVRAFFTPVMFYSEGFKRPQNFRSECEEITPIVVEQKDLEAFVQQNGERYLIWEVAGLSPANLFTFYPRSCTDCTDVGTNIRPPFWE